MIKNITIYNSNERSFFITGEKISVDEKETDIIVDKISYRFGKSKVKLSNGETLIFISKNIKIVK